MREDLHIAAKHGARTVRVFGSVARGEADEASDLDLLVEMEPGRDLLECRVDAVTEKGSGKGFETECRKLPWHYKS